MRRKLRLLLLILVGLGISGFAAYKAIWPLKWPDRPIRVYDATPDYQHDIQRAMTWWNRADVGRRFEFTTDRADADVVVDAVREERIAARRCNHGLPLDSSFAACVDWMGRKPWGPVHVLLPDKEEGWSVATPAVISHEFGHVLGLGHVDEGCATMNPRSIDSCEEVDDFQIVPVGPLEDCDTVFCSRRAKITRVCGPLAHDIDRARALYDHDATGYLSPYCATRDTREIVDTPPHIRSNLLALEEAGPRDGCHDGEGLFRCVDRLATAIENGNGPPTTPKRFGQRKGRQ